MPPVLQADFYQAELPLLLPAYMFQALLNPELPEPKVDPAMLALELEGPQDLLLLLLLLLLPKAFMVLLLLQLLLLFP